MISTGINYSLSDFEGFNILDLSGNLTIHTSDACDSGTFMVNGTSTAVTGSIITAGNNSGGSGQEQLYSCLEEVLSSLSSQSYSTTGVGSWTVGSV